MNCEEKFRDLNQLLPGCKLNKLGRIKPKTSLEIANSGFSIGCECLNRDFWDWDKAYPWLKQLAKREE